MARVWEFSSHAGTDLLMLLAIADFADDDGNAYPAVPTLAAKCRMKPRNCRYLLRSLEASGELSVVTNAGPNGANLYRINLDSLGMQHSAGVQSPAGMQHSAATPAKDCRKPLQYSAAKPSVNHHEPERGVSRSPNGSRLPLDWCLPDEYREWSVGKLGWSANQAEEIAERFADYWHSTTGKSAVKADWFATWRNWCRREKTSGGKQAGNAGVSVFEGAL